MKLANILLVEDCDADAAFFRDFFERQRICNQVTRVCDYQDAWLHVQSVERFDLLVVDIHIPGNGFVTLLRLRRPSGTRVPLPGPTHPLGSPLRASNFGPTLESIPHLFAVRRC
jgi:CheY-like chemotaxis protein